MLKKDITYEDFDGNTVTETFHFHLSKAELLEMEVSKSEYGGLQKHIQKIVATNNGAAIMGVMKEFITSSVGKKSENSQRFVKSPAITDDFLSSPAYDVLFMELCTQPDEAGKFINGVVPAGLAAEVDKLVVTQKGTGMQTVVDPREGGNIFDNNSPVQPIELTPVKMREMDSEELRSGLATGKYILVSE